mgnify:CR=1 FL=1
MKIGIYGGTFNPPHLGHLTAAAAVIATLKLDKLLLIPASIPPHKDLPAGSATAEQRLEMTRMAGEQLGLGSKVETLDMEVRRAGKSFTSDTLAELKAQFPEDELWLLMGTDMFLSFETWHEPEKIASLAGIAAFGRTKADMEPQFSAQRDKLYRLYPDARIFTLTVPGVIDISSTELRERLASGTGENLLPPAVYGYILRNHLYGTDVNLKSLTLSQLRPVALSYLKYKRIPHVLGTEQEAIRLATRYGADVEKARVAALLHDCTKKLDMPEQLALCRQYGIELDELEQKALKLLHAKTGAAIAREVFGVDDEIYRAIWWHTTGHADMTLLEKIIYLADYIEPSRDFPGVDDLRRAVHADLDRGLLKALDDSIRDMQQWGNPVHHNTLEGRAGGHHLPDPGGAGPDPGADAGLRKPRHRGEEDQGPGDPGAGDRRSDHPGGLFRHRHRQLQHPDQRSVRLCGEAAGGAGGGEAPAPGGLPGRYLGAAGLRLHLRPCVQRRGPELL